MSGTAGDSTSYTIIVLKLYLSVIVCAHPYGREVTGSRLEPEAMVGVLKYKKARIRFYNL